MIVMTARALRVRMRRRYTKEPRSLLHLSLILTDLKNRLRGVV